MKIVSKVHAYYKIQIQHIIRYCTNLDPRKTSFAIAAALCIGIVPMFGCTFILATSFGLLFRLNQFIIQSIHILMSPLQILMFYPFVRAGQLVFHLNSKTTLSFRQLPDFVINRTTDFIREYLNIILAAAGVWLIFSLLTGCFLYRLIFLYFTKLKQQKVKAETVTI